MRTLVLGGIRSGKSHWAETSLRERSGVRYIATGPGADSDATWARRIADHRDQRPAAWSTVETIEVARHLRRNPELPTLVDDLGGWVAGVLDRQGWGGESISAAVEDLVAAVDQTAAEVVLVSPEVGLTLVPATESGRRFTDELGTLNQRIAECCERVVLLVAGQPIWIKSGSRRGRRLDGIR